MDDPSYVPQEEESTSSSSQELSDSDDSDSDHETHRSPMDHYSGETGRDQEDYSASHNKLIKRKARKRPVGSQ